MLSDSKKYKDLRSEKHTYKSAIGSKRIEKSLYYIPADYKSAGTIVKSLYYIPADCKSAGTLALLLHVRF